MASSRVIARNTAVLVGAEITTKLASLAFYVVMARELGQEGFGDFTFAMSLAILCVVLTGFGADQILTREVARDRGELHGLFWNTIAIKTVFGVPGIALAVAISFIGDYSAEVRATVAVMAVAAMLELMVKTPWASLQAMDDMVPEAIGKVLQRFSIAGVGIVALLLGADVLDVAIIYLGGTIAVMVHSSWALVRRAGRPLVRVSRQGARRLIMESLPIAVASVFATVMFRIDATILSLMKDNADVGLYGSAYRLLESTLFVSFVFVGAMVPTLSRLTRESTPSVGQAYEAAAKVIVAALLPVGTVFVLFATTLVTVLYGDEFRDAASAVRLLGGAAALYGMTYLSTYVLIAQDRQRFMPWIIGVGAAVNVGLNLLLIPPYGIDGAALVTSISELVVATGFLVFAVRATGGLSPLRVAAGPVVACLGMAGVALVVGTGLGGLVLAAIVYPLVLFAFERRFFPADVGLIVRTITRRGGPIAQPPAPS